MTDWKGTKNPKLRINYINRVLAIDALRGTVFYAAYLNNSKRYWEYTVDALTLAIQRFGINRHSIVRHQGFNYKTREKLRSCVDAIGCSLEIQAGSQEKRCEIRLADALAGYLGLVQFSESESAAYYPDVPGWFVDLKNEAPDQG